ncbi:MAG: hypothetical protein Q8R13_01130, partial [bacterium]|nr:hypothetical protein [bacterium]
PDLVLYQVVTHYVLAALFAFLFAYHLSRNLLFSLGGGLAYAFGGFMVGHAAHVGMQNTATWLPLILLLLIVGLERQKIVYGVWAGLSLGVALLAGHFQTALYAMFAIGLYGVFDTGWVVLRGVIVPVIARARSAPGNPGAGAHRDGTAASASESAAAIGRATTKRAGILVAAFLVAFLIAAIQILPTQELTARSQRSAITLELSQTESLEPSSLAGLVFPNYRNVARGAYEGPWDRTQNYLYVTVTLLACALLGFALGTLLSGRRKLAVFFALLLLVSTLYSIGSYGFLHEYFYRYVPLFDKTRAPANMMVLANLALLGLASIGAAVLNRSARLRALGVPLVLGLAASIAIGVELWNALKDNELLWARKSTEEILAEPWIAANIANEYGALSPMERFTVFGIPEFADNSTQYRKIENFDGYNPLRLMRHAQYVDAMVEHPELVDLAGIKYLPCRYIASRAPTLKRVGELCINDRFLPRAFFADNYVVAAHTADALAKLRMVEVASTLVLEEVPAQEPEEGALNGFGTVDIVQTRPGYWKLLTRTERDRLLFFRQTHYPGWTATIDGVPADLYRANV